MNKENIQKTIQAIKDHPEHYNQRILNDPDCGTPGCIAGYAVLANGARYGEYYGWCIRDDGSRIDIWSHAKEVLGLTKEQAEDMFGSHPMGRIPSAKAAIRMLDNAILTDRVEWFKSHNN